MEALIGKNICALGVGTGIAIILRVCFLAPWLIVDTCALDVGTGIVIVLRSYFLTL